CEARDDLFVGGERRMEHLDRNLLLHQDVRRTIDRAHAAFADLFVNAILASERLPEQRVAGLDEHRTVVWAQSISGVEHRPAFRAFFHQRSSLRLLLREIEVTVSYRFNRKQRDATM